MASKFATWGRTYGGTTLEALGGFLERLGSFLELLKERKAEKRKEMEQQALRQFLVSKLKERGVTGIPTTAYATIREPISLEESKPIPVEQLPTREVPIKGPEIPLETLPLERTPMSFLQLLGLFEPPKKQYAPRIPPTVQAQLQLYNLLIQEFNRNPSIKIQRAMENIRKRLLRRYGIDVTQMEKLPPGFPQ
ncbi:MAG TPA: hypothetical protein ENG63_06765 [Candidatus Desulfofervidus auxilii]|uniref:Uncharacterized protein n=1 Tax=Desulfofervidus auxilii TaxID=1621989 RepID=A0A7C0U379_DESA2|nr:hypothetical protein [Candidatus Desulfofervidus auxilii]